MAYPQGLLSNRSIFKKNNYALISPEGRVKNVVPGFEGCEMTILATPKLGAGFVDYIIKMNPQGKNARGIGGGGVETFVYCIEGKVTACADEEQFELEAGGYLYCPPDKKMYLENNSQESCRLFLYKKRYEQLDDLKTWVVTGNINEVEYRIYEDMENVLIKDFLPTDLAFDMNMHILAFKPGGCHPFIETHYQEHGAYVLTGEGVYNLDNEWIPVQKEDYMFMSAYSLQAAYGVGRELFAYIYSKDCNRDPEI
ncbi:MAG: (S)-ureidoglycine aminohydrolase [Clostridium sp.]